MGCLITVMWNKLASHKTIRKSVSTVVKQVTCGLSRFNCLSFMNLDMSYCHSKLQLSHLKISNDCAYCIWLWKVRVDQVYRTLSVWPAWHSRINKLFYSLLSFYSNFLRCPWAVKFIPLDHVSRALFWAIPLLSTLRTNSLDLYGILMSLKLFSFGHFENLIGDCHHRLLASNKNLYVLRDFGMEWFCGSV